MARNSEKAMTALARWRSAHEEKKVIEIRPFLATECTDLKKAEGFRRKIISEVAKGVAKIQNAGLGEFKIRDLNDQINKLLREKGHWEDRIIELGGLNYRKIGPKMLDREGKEVPGNRGYKYFGAARDLPGVKELFEQAPLPTPKKTRGEIMRGVDAEYYGYRDEDDGVVIPLEAEAELIAVREAVDAWKLAKLAEGDTSAECVVVPEEYVTSARHIVTQIDYDTDFVFDKNSFVSHVAVPSQQEVESALLERRKMELLNLYCTTDDVEPMTEDTDQPVAT